MPIQIDTPGGGSDLELCSESLGSKETDGTSPSGRNCVERAMVGKNVIAMVCVGGTSEGPSSK